MLTSILFLCAIAAFGQHDHEAMVNEHGDHVMGFSHAKSTHHFELNREGGAIDIRANDPRDSETRDQIRRHLNHVAHMFAEGDFSAPMMVHSRAVPGTAEMTRLRDQIHWTVQDTQGGARVNIVADSRPALDAVHEFLRFQIADHKTGDSTAIR